MITPEQQRTIDRLRRRGYVDRFNRGSLPDHVRQSLDAHIPGNLNAIVNHAQTREGDLWWFHDWSYVSG